MFDRLIDFLVDFIDLFRFWTIVMPYEEGVVIRLGKYKKTVTAGWWLIWPFNIDQVLKANVVPTTLDLGEQSVTTADGQSVVVRAFLTWSIFDVRKLLLEVEDHEDALNDVASGYIAQAIAEADWAEVSAADFCDGLKPAIQKRARKWGISVKNVQFSDCTRSKSLRLFN